ncbi:unnamed protein product [Diamesa serratosioi]
MKILFLFCLCLVTVLGAPTHEDWLAYKEKHNKNYDAAEDVTRMELFVKTLAQIEEHNAKYAKGETTYTQGLNHMSDWTPEERSKLTGGLRMPETKE